MHEAMYIILKMCVKAGLSFLRHVKPVYPSLDMWFIIFKICVKPGLFFLGHLFSQFIILKTSVKPVFPSLTSAFTLIVKKK